MTCPNCKKQLSCGCQLKRASDGKQVCTTCMPAYEAKIKGLKNNPQTPIQPNTAKATFTRK